MKRNLRPLVLLLILIAGATILRTTNQNASAIQERAQLTSLSPQARRGKTIYERGESPSGKDISARIGELEVPATSLACAGCHGRKGQGLTEGGVSAGGVSWSYLTNSTSHAHTSGRKHRAFDEQSIARAISECIDASGNKLLAAMPCYQLTPSDLADLVAYLKQIGTVPESGIDSTRITLGSVIPTEGALSGLGAAMKAMLTAYFEELNLNGGIHQRKVELRFFDMTNDPSATVRNIKQLTESNEVFAVVGGLTAGVEKDAVGLAKSQQIPFIGPSSLLPEEKDNSYVFYLSPGAIEQARALVNFAANMPEIRKQKLLILYPETELARKSVSAVEDQAMQLSWANIARHPYSSQAFTAATVVEKLKVEQSDALFFLGSGDQANSLLKGAIGAGWTPNIFIPAFALRDVSLVPKEFKDKIFVGFPSVPSDVTATGVSELAELRQKYKLPSDHVAAQLATLAAAKVFTAAAAKTGRDLTREKLVTTLESFSNFETGLTPKITFGPTRRIGARGAYIVTIDAENKKYSANTIWVEAN